MTRPQANMREVQMRDDDFIVSKTDQSGKIIYGNKTFIQMSGYSEAELLGAPHSILRHPDMPKVVFKLLWETLRKKKEIFAYVKNLAKDGSFYWVFANVTCTLGEGGFVRDYHSVRRKPSPTAMKVIPTLYRELLDEETIGGIGASEKLLKNKLTEQGMSYNDFILTLQQ
ncbi:MAG: PAS domain-containing protein [Sulfurimonas sp.]|jgi:PAS domain S-box-containing protein